MDASMSKLKREQKKAENKNRIDGMKGTNTAAGTLRVLGMPLRLYLLVFLLTLACMIFGYSEGTGSGFFRSDGVR